MRRLLSLLRVETINRIVFRVRFIFFVYVRRRIRVSADQQGVIRPEYSIDMLRRAVTSDRPLRLIRPLSVIDGINPASVDVLSVGCRFETEILYLLGYGFRKVRGLDLIAYSPWVDVGNMHAMPYPNDAWDIVILGWVLSYSETPEAAVREIVRVTRRGGIVAVAVSYYPRSWLEEAERTGRLVGNKERIQTVDGILRLFDGHVDRVYFSHEPSRDVESYCAAIFSIRK
ncbi:MAG: class I SAM-dependent methyltransferase [bacterium]